MPWRDGDGNEYAPDDVNYEGVLDQGAGENPIEIGYVEDENGESVAVQYHDDSPPDLDEED